MPSYENRYISNLTRETYALILAGGRGSRLHELTNWRAKPAVYFGGKHRIIDFPLSNCINSGIRRVGIATQYKSHSLIRHVNRAWGHFKKELGESVEILPASQRFSENWYEGTADAVFQNIDIIREIVDTLDIPVKQVQIEARIVSVSEGNLDELGVRWGFSSTNGSTTAGGSIESNLDQVGLLKGDSTVDDFLNVNLAASASNASSIAFQVAKLGSDLLLDLELSALQRESKAEVISSPRLITTNKKPAYIEQGTEIPYLESSSSGATSIAFKKAVLSLKVTPQITPDNRLVLDLSVTQDRPGEVVKTGTGEAVSINTQRIGTQVLVDNGETVVLGGIFQHNVTDTVDKVPLLGDLPLLGGLFRRSYQSMGKSELLIFVTPKVVIQ